MASVEILICLLEYINVKAMFTSFTRLLRRTQYQTLEGTGMARHTTPSTRRDDR